MGIDFGKTFDAVGDGVKNVGEVAHKSTENFHKKFVSKITPKDGKFGDATKFVAETVPGVSEYNAAREGDWKAFTIAAGIDVAMIGVTVATAGLATGPAVAVKAGTEVGITAVKTVMREGTEAVAKKAIKEGNEAVAEITVINTTWSKETIDSIRSMEEYSIYKNAGLKEQTLGGKTALVRNDINPNQKDDFGRSNVERIKANLSPINKNGETIELHHVGQKADSTLAELTREEHRGIGNDTILHDKDIESKIDRTEFKSEKNQYWRARLGVA
jgi:hypothetical protein